MIKIWLEEMEKETPCRLKVGDVKNLSLLDVENWLEEAKKIASVSPSENKSYWIMAISQVLNTKRFLAGEVQMQQMVKTLQKLAIGINPFS